MAVPKAQHFDGVLRFLYEIENAVGVFEDRELLRFRVSGVPKEATRARYARVAQLSDCFGGQVSRYCAPRSGSSRSVQ